MGCMSKIRWRIDWWGNIQYSSISGWCNVKMCQMCQMWNITDIRHNLKMLRWHARWHERAFSLFVTYFLFPWQNHWCWWQTEHPIKFPIFGIFENFKIFSYPPPYVGWVHGISIYSIRLVLPRFWKIGHICDTWCSHFFIFDVKPKSSILHQVEYRYLENFVDLDEFL